MYFLSNIAKHFFAFFLTITLLLFVVCPHGVHADVTLDGTLGPKITLQGPDFQIKSEHGTIVGNYNLFHSFDKFSINNTQTATFSGPDTIKNVVGRVTGGELSNIDGLIRSTFSTANLYLLNPSGVLLGPNAKLDVKGSFHVSTGDYISMGSTGIFYTDPIKTSVLTVDAPTAFGFLNSNPAGISVNQSDLTVPEGKTISLIGGDIDLTGFFDENNGDFIKVFAELTAPAGRIDIASVSSPGEVIRGYSENGPYLTTDSIETLGNINMYLTYADSGGNGGGTVFIRGGKLTVDTTYVYASTKGISDNSGAGIDIEITGDMKMEDTIDFYDPSEQVSNPRCDIATNIFSGVDQDSGGVRITADHMEINYNAGIRSLAYWGADGRTGDIEVTTDQLTMKDFAAIQTGTQGAVKSGSVIINTGDMEIKDGAYIYSSTSSSTGDGGDIFVTADTLYLSELKYTSDDVFTGITAQVFADNNWEGSGNGGNITLDVKNLEMLAGAEISAPKFWYGKGGNIKVGLQDFASITITGMDGISTGIFTNTFWSGAKGGNIDLKAGSLKLSNHGSIELQSIERWPDSPYGPFPSGDAGNLTLTIDSLEIYDSGFITTAGFFGLGGSSGNIDISSRIITISGPESSSDPFGKDTTGIVSNSGERGGTSGDIAIKTTDLLMSDRGLISSTALGPDQGGSVHIDAENVEILNGAAVTAGAFGSGDSGTLTVSADTLRISGVHPETYIDETTNAETLAPSGIASQAGLGGGKGSSITITAGILEVMDGGIVGAETFGAGNAGNINITSDQLLVSGQNADMLAFRISNGTNTKHSGSKISANSSNSFLGDDATGNGGNIKINTTRFGMAEGGIISTETTTPGQGGNIDISAENSSLLSNASISAMSTVSEIGGDAGNINISTISNFTMNNASLLTSAAEGMGGDITVHANDMDLINNASISAESSGQGDAGNIYLAGHHAFSINNSQVTTDATQADGGNIKVYADYLVHLVDSEITASVGGGSETSGGNISIDPKYVILDYSNLVANAFEGQGGNINIISEVFLADPGSSIDASSSFGIDGQVDIQSPITHVSGIASPLSKDFRSVVALLRKPCMARVHKGKYSSFMLSGRDSLPVDPSRFLSSPLSIQ